MLEFNYTILVQFLNLLILLVLLNFFLFKPVLRVLQKRRSFVASLGEKVGDVKEEAQALKKTYEDGLKEKKRPVLEGKESSIKEAHDTSLRLVDEARHHLTEELAKIKGDVKKEADRALLTLTAESDRLAMEVVRKVLKRGAL